jgi:predicted nucleic acid-binding protein
MTIVRKVVDASALIAVIFSEPGAEMAAEHMHNAALIAPPLIHFEFTNICLVKFRRNLVARDRIPDAFALFAQFQIEFVQPEMSQVFELADVTGLSAYDASYLWLAKTRNAGLVTLDKRLAAACAN